MNLTNSFNYFERARQVIPSCTQTFSKGWTQFPFGVSPIFLSRADGCYVWDVDGNRYIDSPMALGPIILGHNHPSVVEAVTRQLTNGVAFSLPHFQEVELAEELCRLIPCAEMVRFGKNGSDATAGAVRVSRAYTGRDYVACCGYHGWQDWYIGTTTRSKGVPEDVRRLALTFEYNKIETLEKLFNQYPNKIGCVILEPTGVVPPTDNFLGKVVDLSHAHGALVVFDECWTGFRFSIGGAQEYFSVTPDLACFGKALGNGFPISAVVGRREIMQLFDEVFFSFTFGGDMCAIAAARGVLRELTTKDVLPYIWKLGATLFDGISRLIREYQLSGYIRLDGYAPKMVLTFSRDGEEWLELKSLAQQEMIRRGVLYAGYHVISYAHTETDVEHILNCYREVLPFAKMHIEADTVQGALEGRAVQPVFRKL